MHRYVNNVFLGLNAPTIGVDFANKQLTKQNIIDSNINASNNNVLNITKQANGSKEDEVMRLQLWDTAGSEMFRSINKIYYNNVHGVALIFDLTSLDSFKNLDFWLNDFM